MLEVHRFAVIEGIDFVVLLQMLVGREIMCSDEVVVHEKKEKCD